MKKIKLLTGLVGITGLSVGLIPVISGCSCTQAKVESIKVTTQPTKTTYTEGETLDLTGMVVTATYSDKSTKEVTDYTTSPSTSKQLATTDTKVVVTYGGFTDEFAITVNPAIEQIPLTYNATSGKYESAALSQLAINKDYMAVLTLDAAKTDVNAFYLGGEGGSMGAAINANSIIVTVDGTKITTAYRFQSDIIAWTAVAQQVAGKKVTIQFSLLANDRTSNIGQCFKL